MSYGIEKKKKNQQSKEPSQITDVFLILVSLDFFNDLQLRIITHL